MKRRVVITGLGALTALGEGADALWNAAAEGRSGIGVLDVAAASGQWKVPAGMVHDFSPEKFVTQRKSLKVMARDIQLLWRARASLSTIPGSVILRSTMSASA